MEDIRYPKQLFDYRPIIEEDLDDH